MNTGLLVRAPATNEAVELQTADIAHVKTVRSLGADCSSRPLLDHGTLDRSNAYTFTYDHLVRLRLLDLWLFLSPIKPCRLVPHSMCIRLLYAVYKKYTFASIIRRTSGSIFV